MKITRNIAGRWAGPSWAGVDWGLGSGRWAVKKRCFYNDFCTPPIKNRVFYNVFCTTHSKNIVFRMISAQSVQIPLFLQ